MMLNMMINEKNTEKIEAIIKEVEGKATVRTILMRDILDGITHVERELDIPKKAMEGIKIDVDVNAQDFPNAYKWTPMSTQFRAQRVKSGWKLLEVSRSRTRRMNQRYLVKLTDDARAAILTTKTHFA